ncbi:MAG: hypothetical protein BAJALOKI1v1_530022 [Promethearchaeota archaeon]|nr:MAG: hypothetical protein BAJALOKI1v1_530022 [Candidatus Lokiarchaeota archaeon]
MSLFSSHPSLQKELSEKYESLNKLETKYKAPVILRIYGMLNKLDLKLENRYIICNFLDKYLLEENIYQENNKKSLNQLFLTAIRKAKDSELVDELFEEYIESFKAICQKKDFSSKSFE